MQCTKLISLIFLSFFSINAMQERNEEAYLATNIAKQILQGKYKKAFVAGGVMITMQVATGLCLNMAIGGYHALKEKISRAVSGPTKQDIMYNLTVQQNIAQLKKQQLALHAANEEVQNKINDLKREQLEKYKTYMHQEMSACANDTEKEEIQNRLKEIKKKFEEAWASDILNNRTLIIQR